MVSTSLIPLPQTIVYGLGASSENDLNLLHRRLGRLHPTKLHILFPSMPRYNGDFSCTTCIKAKQVTNHYPIVENHSDVPFEIVHSNNWGLAPCTSISGFKYYVSFVDGGSRYTTVYLMRFRDEVTSIFLKYHKMIQAQFNATIKILRSDNAKEYLSKDFQ